MKPNTVKTFALLAGLAGVLILAGQVVAGTGGALIGMALALVVVGSSYWFSDRIAIRASGAVPISKADMPGLHAAVADLAHRAGLPAPRLYLSPAAQPNAFATGRNEHHAIIAVTQGLLDELSPQEVRAVLAHEVAHIANRDILIGSVAAALATGVTMIANIVTFGAMFGGDDEDAPGLLGLAAMAVVAPLAATLLQLAVSRSREYEADRTGAALLGDGAPLASALTKIEGSARRTPMPIEPAQSTHFIINPLTGRTVRFANLFLTHPPTDERIAKLLHAPTPAR